MNKQTHIIHIGFQKAGSTWLQQNFFPKILNSNVIISPPFVNEINSVSDLQLDISKIKGSIEEITVENKQNILTSEGLVGNVLGNASGCWDRTCNRLKLLFPDGKIIMVIRNQLSMLKSIYKHEIRMGYGFSFHSFYYNHCMINHVFDMLDYYSIVKYYMKNFKDLKVIPLETLFTKETTVELCKFIKVEDISENVDLNTKQNEGFGSWSLYLTKKLNAFTGTKIQRFDNLFIYPRWRYSWSKKVDKLESIILRKNSKPYLIPEELKLEIHERFGESNHKLASLLNIDLAKLGYYTKKT